MARHSRIKLTPTPSISMTSPSSGISTRRARSWLKRLAKQSVRSASLLVKFYTSHFNRAFETAALAGFKDAKKTTDLAESGLVVSPVELWVGGCKLNPTMSPVQEGVGSSMMTALAEVTTNEIRRPPSARDRSSMCLNPRMAGSPMPRTELSLERKNSARPKASVQDFQHLSRPNIRLRNRYIFWTA